MSEAVVIREPSAVAKSDPESILRYAIDKGADVSVIERMMAIRRELQQEQAKAAFDSALAAFQAECPVISKQKEVPDRSGKTAYKYAPFEDIIAQVKHLLHKHGFSYALDTDTESKDGWVIAKCQVTHQGGHTDVKTAKLPLGTKTPVMSDTQVYAAALTFASRRVFCNAFGIVTAGEDMDGRIGKVKPAGPSTLAPDRTELKALAGELWAALATVRGADKNWKAANQWLWDEAVIGDQEEAPNLTPARFKEVTAKAKEKLHELHKL